MTKADIVERIAAATGLTRVETEAVVEGFMICVREALVRGDGVELRGFGSFRVQERAARLGRNPASGEPVPVPPRRLPVFRPARELRLVVDPEGFGAAPDPDESDGG